MITSRPHSSTTVCNGHLICLFWTDRQQNDHYNIIELIGLLNFARTSAAFVFQLIKQITYLQRLQLKARKSPHTIPMRSGVILVIHCGRLVRFAAFFFPFRILLFNHFTNKWLIWFSYSPSNMCRCSTMHKFAWTVKTHESICAWHFCMRVGLCGVFFFAF